MTEKDELCTERDCLQIEKQVLKTKVLHVLIKFILSSAANLKVMGVFCFSHPSTVVPTKSDSDVIFCLQLLSKILTCTLHLG